MALLKKSIAFWYSPLLFAKPWMKEMGLSKDDIKKDQNKMGGMYALSFLGALVMAYMLSHVMTFSMNYLKYSAIQTGISTAIFMWLGFVAPVQMTEVIFGGKTWRLYALNTGYQLVSLLVMGLVVGVMGA